MSGPAAERPGLADLVGALVDVFDGADPDTPGAPLVVSQLDVSTPIELEVHQTEAGRVELRASPPTQRVETGVMPVWDRLQVSLRRDPDVLDPDHRAGPAAAREA